MQPADVFTAFAPGDLDITIPARFERQVKRYPTRLAVKDRGRSFTYAELNEQANRIAHAIIDQRSERPETVALLIGQGAMLISAILGVLKAGRIYVPLDPRHPPSRLAHLLQDAQAALILADSRHVALAESFTRSPAGTLDIERIDGTAPASNPTLSFPPSALACIYYTSGSTGPPKGVVDSHRNVLHNIMRYTNGLGISPGDRMTLVQSCSFSGCVSTQFGALLNGAALFPFDLHEEGTRGLAELMLREQITMYHSVPALFRAVVDGAGRFPSLRMVRLEGDQSAWHDVSLFQQHCCPPCRLANGLGTTETGLVRRYLVDHHTVVGQGALPAGYAIDDMDVLLVDEEGVVVDDGDIGEIAVRSAYLAVGYWRRPELTGQVFRPDPAGGNTRTYCTGDLGRLASDGCLEYLGRKDFHGKVRGHRVEVRAVEKALLDLGAFRDVVVITREDHPGEPRAVAYLVAEQTPPPINVMRRALEQTLPQYTIPSAFVLLDQLPLTENGKVDRRALPPPGNARPSLDVSYVAPSTPLEARVAAVWAEVLQLDRVGVHDHFLDLGGDSLLAGRVLARLRTSLGIDLPLGAIFEAPTIADLSRVIAQPPGPSTIGA
jgi:amino acid adenylation domain-containing protein